MPSNANKSWGYIKEVSPSIPAMRAVIDHVQYNINRFARYRRHSSPSAKGDIDRLAKSYRENKVHKPQGKRQSNDEIEDLVHNGASREILDGAIKRWWD